MRRRGIIAALLAPLAAAQEKEPSIRWIEPSSSPLSLILTLSGNKPDTPCITVTALGRTVTLTTAEVMDALAGK